MRGKKRTANCMAVLAMAVILPFAASLRAQVAAPGVQNSGDQQTRKDAWRLVAQTPSPPPTDPKEREIFNARARDFDEFIGLRVPLSPDLRWGTDAMGDCEEVDEIPFVPNEAIVVAKFDDFQTIFTPSQQSIYTRVTLGVEQVLDPGPSKVSAGQMIDLLLPGGTITMSDGRRFSFWVFWEHRDYAVQPGHRYLFFLRYQGPEADYFSELQEWDLLDGKAMANSCPDLKRVSNGRSTLNGLSEDIFLDTIRAAIARHK